MAQRHWQGTNLCCDATQTITSQQKKQKRSLRAYGAPYAKKCGFLGMGLTTHPRQPYRLTFLCLLCSHLDHCLGPYCSGSRPCYAQSEEEVSYLTRGRPAPPRSRLTHLGHLRRPRADQLQQEREVEVEVAGGQRWEEGGQ